MATPQQALADNDFMEVDNSEDEFDDDQNRAPYPTAYRTHTTSSSTTNTAKMHLPATPFSSAYRSPFILESTRQHLLPLLQHLNCSYLSTTGVAPSLVQLKQHAQALCVLIKAVSVSSRSSIVDVMGEMRVGRDGKEGNWDVPQHGLGLQFATAEEENAENEPMEFDEDGNPILKSYIPGPGLGEEYQGGISSIQGETWDWLDDLETPYTGPDEAKKGAGVVRRHKLPLTGILNVLMGKETSAYDPVVEDGEIKIHCPLYTPPAASLSENSHSLPYATHQSLIAHANRILELLDHEYSAKGGLMAILPPEHETDDRKKAESTILGQQILFTQRLVSRLHELEREYANALDIIAGESKVPSQTLSRLGPSGRQGRELVYPQDRFVLVNAGQDVWEYLDREFSERERVDEVVKENYLRHGVTGESLWEKRGGKEFARGITAIDVTTRYFRLRNDPLKTIFVIPAHKSHPGVQATVDLEKVPTVVSVVKPIWPERHSLWEQQNRQNLEELKHLRRENAELKEKDGWSKDEKNLLRYDNQLKDGESRQLRRELKELDDIVNGKQDANGNVQQMSDFSRKFYKDWNDLGAREAKLKTDEAKIAADIAAAQLSRQEAQALKVQAEREVLQARDNQKRQTKELERKFKQREEQIEDLDREVTVAALELERKANSVLRGQVKEMRVLLEWFRQRKVQVEGDYVDGRVVEEGLRFGEEELPRGEFAEGILAGRGMVGGEDEGEEEDEGGDGGNGNRGERPSGNRRYRPEVEEQEDEDV